VKSERDNPPEPASILAIGAVTPLGRDLDAITAQLEKPVPAATKIPQVGDDLLLDPAIGARMRRADRFARMAAIAALDAWVGDDIPKQRIGLIVTSGFGPHCRGFKFLDGILDCGDSDALPTDFSHSVHGAAAAYITEILELRGPSLTTTDFEFGFEQAVLLAQCWLNQRVCDRVVVGAVEEIGEVLVHCASRMLAGEKRFVPGEGAVFFTLGPAGVKGLARLDATSQAPDVDLMLLDMPAIPPHYAQRPTVRARQTTTFSPWFGHSASSSAFQLLGGFLSIRAGRPLGRLVQTATDMPTHPKDVDKVATYKPSCAAGAASLLMTRWQSR
jgi:hypothetical protein